MKYALIFSILATLLGGCAIAPTGYGDNRGEYSRERGYSRGDGNYREYSYRGERSYQGDAYRDHGS